MVIYHLKRFLRELHMVKKNFYFSFKLIKNIHIKLHFLLLFIKIGGKNYCVSIKLTI